MTARVKDRKIVLDASRDLPEGATLRLREVQTGYEPTLLERMAPFVGMLDLPGDLATNHDHYAHGAPKR